MWPKAHAAQTMQGLFQFRHEFAAALIKADGDAVGTFDGRAVQQAHHFREQSRGNAVGGKKPQILKNVEDRAFSRT